MKIKHIVLLFFMLTFYGLMFGQVTIGSGTSPQKFSILEIVSNHVGGLRLPHLTTAERDALSGSAEFAAESHRGDAASSLAPGLALGLTIYNTDVNCVEYWNGYKWVSLCLGSSDIVLKSPCGDYDFKNPPIGAGDGSSSGCVYTPEDKIDCVVSSGRAYEVYLVAGSTFATLSIDPVTSAFTINFSPNTSTMARNAIVRVVNNCTGEFKDFIFPQDGATCTSDIRPTLNSNNLKLCLGGSVYAHVTNVESGVDYFWTLSGVVVHRGNWFEIKQAGEYKVYGGVLGCGTPAELTVSLDDSSISPIPITISATNGGVLCASGNVILTADTSEPVVWYHNGLPHSSRSNPLTVSGGAMSGRWFAAVDNGDCVSSSSNVLTLIDNTEATTALPIPQASVNGQGLIEGLIICKSGTLKLEVTNATSFPSGTEYEWFSDGVSIGKGTSPIMYTVSPTVNRMTLSVTASNESGNCPNTSVSLPTSVTLTAPSITSINNGAVEVGICGGVAKLVATRGNGVDYEWFKDGITISGAREVSLDVSEVGEYSVRYKDTNGCWSPVSTTVNVIQSSSLNMNWQSAPVDVIKGQEVTYSITSSPVAKKYEWSYSVLTAGAEGTVVSLTPSSDGLSATVKYANKGVIPNNIEPEVELTVRSVGHYCGDVSLKRTIKVGNGCIEGTYVELTPKITNTRTVGDEISFTATTDASNNKNDLRYEWFVKKGAGDNASQGTFPPTTIFKYKFNSADEYTVSVRVTNECTVPSSEITDQTIFNVQVNPGDYTPDTSGQFKLTGKDCFDVVQSNFNDNCGSKDQRPGDFLTGGVWDSNKSRWTYELVQSVAIDNLQFVISDPNVLIASHTTSGNKFTITFSDQVLQKAKGKTREEALEIKVYALFELRSTGAKRRVEFIIKVQDCMCGCGAFVGSQWREFMCHNLGATESADPFKPNAQIHGAKYKFGAKDPHLTQAQDQDPVNYPYNGGNYWLGGQYQTNAPWELANDPCRKKDARFRVPTMDEWESLMGNPRNSLTAVGSNWTAGSSNFTTGFLLGSRLFLPAAGIRYYSQGVLNYRGSQGEYWSTSPGVFQLANGAKALVLKNVGGATWTTRVITLLQEGLSVRCIADR